MNRELKCVLFNNITRASWFINHLLLDVKHLVIFGLAVLEEVFFYYQQGIFYMQFPKRQDNTRYISHGIMVGIRKNTDHRIGSLRWFAPVMCAPQATVTMWCTKWNPPLKQYSRGSTLMTSTPTSLSELAATTAYSPWWERLKLKPASSSGSGFLRNGLPFSVRPRIISLYGIPVMSAITFLIKSLPTWKIKTKI